MTHTGRAVSDMARPCGNNLTIAHGARIVINGTNANPTKEPTKCLNRKTR
jgi:hypothetical protein